jgi:alkylhydroperoxidase/carboxymuconolactone decarboxylase family protein YurZ
VSITTLDPRIPAYIGKIAKRPTRTGKVVTGGIVSVRDSSWLLSWTVNRQSHFKKIAPGPDRCVVLCALHRAAGRLCQKADAGLHRRGDHQRVAAEVTCRSILESSRSLGGFERVDRKVRYAMSNFSAARLFGRCLSSSSQGDCADLIVRLATVLPYTKGADSHGTHSTSGGTSRDSWTDGFSTRNRETSQCTGGNPPACAEFTHARRARADSHIRVLTQRLFLLPVSHGAIASAHLNGDEEIVRRVTSDFRHPAILEKLKGLLHIAERVQKGGKNVTPRDIEEARKAGATDIEIHDTVLIAAAFCMYNRYVDGLATW